MDQRARVWQGARRASAQRVGETGDPGERASSEWEFDGPKYTESGVAVAGPGQSKGV